jgi:DNA-binding PadR family transcriptional regulator
MEDFITDKVPLGPIAIWALIGLSDEPTHIYGLKGRVYGASMSYVSPSVSTLRKVVYKLVDRGYVEFVGNEPARASGHERNLYFITPQGLRALYDEEIALGMARQGIKRALAQSVLRSSGGGPILARRG